MKKNYSLVLLGLLATANISIAMDNEDFDDDGNGRRSSSHSFDEIEIIEGSDDEEDEDNPEKQNVLAVMKPGFDVDAVSQTIDWIVTCINDNTIFLTEEKPTIADLIQRLSYLSTYQDQQTYLEDLWSAFLSANPVLEVSDAELNQIME